MSKLSTAVHNADKQEAENQLAKWTSPLLASLLDDFYQASYDLSNGSTADEVHKARAAIYEHVAKLISDSEAKHHLVQDTAEQINEKFQTSLIRAAMASVLEAVPTTLVLDRDDNGIVRTAQVTISLEAQATVWDRFELSTTRTPDEKSVVFTLNRNT